MKYLLVLGFLGMASAFQPADRTALKTAVDACIDEDSSGDCCRADDGTFTPANGQPCVLPAVHISEWDTSLVTDFHQLFSGKKQFNQNLGAWDTSQGTTFYDMFYNANAFANKNQTLDWDTSSATNMQGMFQYTPFNQCLCEWDTSKVTTMQNMFYSRENAMQSKFNQDISCWDVSRVTTFDGMFGGSYSSMAQTLCWDNDFAESQLGGLVDTTCISTGCVVPPPPAGGGEAESEGGAAGDCCPDCSPAQYIDAQCCQCS